MALTLSQFQSRATSVLRDSDNNIVTTTDLMNWANEAKSDLAHRQKPVSKTATGTTSGSTIAIPSDYVSLKSFRMGEDDLEITDDQTFFDATDAGNAFGHTIAVIHASAIEMYPAPTTGTSYSFRYFYEPADMALAADTSGLPAEFDRKIVQYMQAHGKYKLGEDVEGDRYMAMYEEGLNARSLGADRNRPGPLNLHYEPGPFEWSSYLNYG